MNRRQQYDRVLLGLWEQPEHRQTTFLPKVVMAATARIRDPKCSQPFRRTVKSWPARAVSSAQA